MDPRLGYRCGGSVGMTGVPCTTDGTDFPFYPGAQARRSHLTGGIVQSGARAVKHLTAGAWLRIKGHDSEP